MSNYKIGDRVWVTADGTWFEEDGPGTVTDINEQEGRVRVLGDCHTLPDHAGLWIWSKYVRLLMPKPHALAMTGDADFFVVALSNGRFWTWNASDHQWRRLPDMPGEAG